MKLRPRHTNEEIKARLIFIIAIGLVAVFVISICAMLINLLYVTQPVEMSQMDAETWKTLNPLLMTLGGALVGVVASNGLRDKPKDPPA
jgi:cytochrome c-type biogenesis protein CcmE